MTSSRFTHGVWRVAIVAGITLAGVWLRVYRIGDESLWLDEGISAYLANLSWGELFGVFAAQRANMALYMVVLKLWIAVFSDSETALRMLSVVFSALSIPALEALGRRLFSPATGYVAAALLALHKFDIYYAREARSYTMLMLVVILATGVFVSMLESPSKRNVVLYALLITAGIYAQFMALFALLGHAASLLVGRPAGAVRRFGASVAIVAALTVPLLFVMQRNDVGRIGWIAPLSAAQVFSVAVQFAPYVRFWAVGLVALCAAAAVMAMVRPGSSPAPRRLLVWAAAPLALSVLVSAVRPMLVPRYLLYGLPFFLLLLAYGATSLRWKSARLAAAAVLIIVTALGSGRAWVARKEDWRTAATIVASNAKPGDALLFVDPMIWRPYQYYARRGTRPAPAVVYPKNSDFPRFTDIPTVADLAPAGSAPRVWVIRHRDSRDRGLRLIRLHQAIGARHHRVRSWRLAAGTVELWTL